MDVDRLLAGDTLRAETFELQWSHVLMDVDRDDAPRPSDSR